MKTHRKNRVCGNCRYYKKRSKKSGNCARHTVIVLDTKKDTTKKKEFHVHKHDYCAEHLY